VDLSNSSAAFEILCRKMIAMHNSERLKLLSSLPGLLEAELPKSPPDRFAPLSWEDLRTLASQGLDIGAHTVQHPILSKLPTEAEIHYEIAGSKEQIETATGAPVKHFCYPNGKLADVNEAAVASAEAAGFRTAVLAEPGLVHPPFALHRLKRIGVDPDLPPLYFERCVAGYRL
jgi:peptidoglycan/xylan/chitin deacetylase (PgdA/CDA1 family)